jgi:hypothetical protein
MTKPKTGKMKFTAEKALEMIDKDRAKMEKIHSNTKAVLQTRGTENMMSKPKTGKAIMTEIEEELLETLNKIDSEETRNIIIGYVEALRTQYKEQGIVQGRQEERIRGKKNEK